MFAIVSNLDYGFRILKGNFSFKSASIAHTGIAMILLGALLSNANSQVISIWQSRYICIFAIQKKPIMKLHTQFDSKEFKID